MQGSVRKLYCSLSICLNLFMLGITACFAYGKTSVSFKVIKMVSWWSLRVSTPFSLLCLTFNWFSQNRKFPSKYAYYLNSAFTFGKQTKDNFINRKFQCRSTYSFTHFRAHFSLGRVAGAAILGGPNMPHDQQQSQFPWVHTKMGSTKVSDVVRLPGSWTTSGPLSRGCSQKDMPRQSFLPHSGHMAEPT